ncbi:MAG: hypothetical protein ACOCV2_09185, partial [Persicimonas sp.]
ASLVCATFGSADALPRQALESGSPCSTCHVNQQGGGMRSMIGWDTAKSTGLVDYEDVGLDWLQERYTNEIVEGTLAVGFDARIQMARLGRPTVETGDEPTVRAPDRRIFPMQLQPHMMARLTDYLKLHGSYAAGPNTFDGEICDTPYPGQSCYVAEAIAEPLPPWPIVRAGVFQPSIGIRHDDHTMLIRADASRPRTPLIPPNYAELGAEARYTPVNWLDIDVGGFRAANLSESVGNREVVDENDVAYLGRVTLRPRFDVGDDLSFSALVGASGYGAGQFHMQNAFAGLGLLDRASLIVEGAHFTRGPSTTGVNLATLLSVQTAPWLVLHGRLERAWTETSGGDFQTDQAVAGVQFYPLPFFSLRPEYRVIDTDTYAMGQYTAQLHVFY